MSAISNYITAAAAGGFRAHTDELALVIETPSRFWIIIKDNDYIEDRYILSYLDKIVNDYPGCPVSEGSLEECLLALSRRDHRI